MTSSGWKRWRARNEWFAADLYVGVLVFGLVLASTLSAPDMLKAGQPVLYAVLGAGLAIAGLVFAGLALFVALISDDYLSVLRANPRGLSAAWRPYIVVAWVALVAAGSALVLSVLWEGFEHRGQSLGLAFSVGLLAWAIFGVGQLVLITKFHGEMRAELLSHRLKAKALLLQRKSERDKSA